MAPLPSPISRSFRVLAWCLGACLTLPAWELAAQAPPAKAPAAAPVAAAGVAAKKDDKPKIPDPQDVTLETKDNVLIRCTYFPGHLEKKAAAIIMIPGFGGSRKEFDVLAKQIQSLGHAVITVDPRGHGDSVTRKVIGGNDEKLDLTKMKRDELEKIVVQGGDLETVKTFLIEKNNAGELNIEMLAVVGSEFGAIMAANWAILDWGWPILPSKKQGQDVKAIAMLSPILAEKSIKMPALAGSNIAKLSYMFIAGKNDPKSQKDAKSLEKTIENLHWKLPLSTPPAAAPKLRQENQSLFLTLLDTKLQGTELLKDRAVYPGVSAAIVGFIHYRVVVKGEELPWAMR